jgi:SNF2 family DNA or RNA helicase
MSAKIFLIDHETLGITFDYDRLLVEEVKKLPVRYWNKVVRRWEIPIYDLVRVLKVFREDVLISNLVEERFRQLQVEQEKILKIKQSKAEDILIEFPPLKLPPFDYQKVCAVFAASIGRVLIADDTGIGKSAEAILSALVLQKYRSAKKSLVFCPSSLKRSWQTEIQKFSQEKFVVIEGEGKFRRELYKKDAFFTIVNYDLSYRDLDVIRSVPWDVVILDEASRIKNWETRTSQAIKKIQSRFLFALTGTPIENSVMELFSIIEAVNPKIFGQNKIAFMDRYCILDAYKNVVGYRNLDEIREKLQFCMIRRMKREVLKELPPLLESVRFVTLTIEQQKQYDKIKSGILEMKKGGRLEIFNLLQQLVYLQQAAVHTQLVDEKEVAASSKLDECRSIVEEVIIDNKIVIFSRFVKMVEILQKEFERFGAVSYMGNTPNSCRADSEGLDSQDCSRCIYARCGSRKEFVFRFNNDDSCRVFISSDAGAYGVNLTNASYLILMDLLFNPSANYQRKSRIMRASSKVKSWNIISIISSNTMEERTLKILEAKQKISDDIIDTEVSESESNSVFRSMSLNDICKLL